MECDLGWEVHPSGHLRSGKMPPLTVPIRLGHKTVTVFLDTGSSVSLVRAHLIPLTQPVLRYTDVAGTNQQVCRWPVVQMLLTYNTTTYRVEVLKVDDLPFPVLLGRDAPAFDTLVHSSLPRLAAVMDEEEQPGSSRVCVDDPKMQTLTWDTDKDFLRRQETAPILSLARDNIAIEEGQMLDVRRAARLPRFEKVRRILW